MTMNKLTTITVSYETKHLLEKIKGEETWDTFLRKIAVETLKKRRENIREKLAELLEVEFEEVKVKKWAREY